MGGAFILALLIAIIVFVASNDKFEDNIRTVSITVLVVLALITILFL